MDWGQEEKGTTEDEMVGRHHRLNGYGHPQSWFSGLWTQTELYQTFLDLREEDNLDKLFSFDSQKNHMKEVKSSSPSPSTVLYSRSLLTGLCWQGNVCFLIYRYSFSKPPSHPGCCITLSRPQNFGSEQLSITGKQIVCLFSSNLYLLCLLLLPGVEQRLVCVWIQRLATFCFIFSVLYKNFIELHPPSPLSWVFILQKYIEMSLLPICLLGLFTFCEFISSSLYNHKSVMWDGENVTRGVSFPQALPSECQMLLFSATFEDSVWQFAERIIPDPNVIKLRKEELTLNNIRQYYVLCENRKDKYQALCNIYGGITIGQAIIFCQTRRNAKWLTVEMMQDGHQVSLLSGELTVDQRASIIQRFRDGKEKVLITTNVCARGIDVKQITIVVNFDLPVNRAEEPDYETYLHRIGRTGRFGKKGLAFNMIEVDKLPLLKKIQDHFSDSIKQLDPEDMDEIEKIEY
ncbi:hypothetical protein FD755_010756 [Muntiacus reevesi]|uniref:RNA helicase n=1 Tax=Muntiacus reevesi TaxID=9886 RepID=A0A5N3XR68_MUNRE|nr:hypothetical protein FD755_010756 [Muntiacus reevesi]